MSAINSLRLTSSRLVDDTRVTLHENIERVANQFAFCSKLDLTDVIAFTRDAVLDGYDLKV